LADANLPYVLGTLTAVNLAIALPAVFAGSLRRRIDRVFGAEMSKIS
jgi:hypothetical protein